MRVLPSDVGGNLFAKLRGRGSKGAADGASEGATGFVAKLKRYFLDGGVWLGQKEPGQSSDQDVISEACEFAPSRHFSNNTLYSSSADLEFSGEIDERAGRGLVQVDTNLGKKQPWVVGHEQPPRTFDFG